MRLHNEINKSFLDDNFDADNHNCIGINSILVDTMASEYNTIEAKSLEGSELCKTCKTCYQLNYLWKKGKIRFVRKSKSLAQRCILCLHNGKKGYELKVLRGVYPDIQTLDMYEKADEIWIKEQGFG